VASITGQAIAGLGNQTALGRGTITGAKDGERSRMVVVRRLSLIKEFLEGDRRVSEGISLVLARLGGAILPRKVTLT
jgi:hypothetical protein